MNEGFSTDRHADAGDSGAEVSSERVERRRADIVVPDECSVRIEHVEDVEDQAEVDHVDLQRLCRSNIGVPQVWEPKRVDLRRDQHLKILIR